MYNLLYNPIASYGAGSIWIERMTRIIYAAVILIALIAFQYASEQSDQFWENVGPEMDKTLNPSKYEN